MVEARAEGNTKMAGSRDIPEGPCKEEKDPELAHRQTWNRKIAF